MQVGRAMCAADADAKVQAQILGHFTQQLLKPALSQRETAVAVEAVGALAASTNRNFGEPVSPACRNLLRTHSGTSILGCAA